MNRRVTPVGACNDCRYCMRIHVSYTVIAVDTLHYAVIQAGNRKVLKF